MANSWKVVAAASRTIVEQALAAQEADFAWPEDWVVTAEEIAGGNGERWSLAVYLEREPDAVDIARIGSLFARRAPALAVEKLPDEDWTLVSQQRVRPIRAGRFHVRTPDYPPAADAVDFVIPASQAFGTGHHETTAGCLAMLDLMRRQGVRARNIADIGTGTGLLAFAARYLWPRAAIVASDNDPVCLPVIEENARLNHIPLGTRRGAVATLIAEGMDDPRLAARAPFDLVIANILAGPLIDLAPDFAAHSLPGANLVLSGLLESQEAAVRRACRRAGYRLARRHVRGDWSILWLRLR